MAQGTAVVTGVSSGIGRAIAARLAEEGYTVFGTVRRPDSQAPAGVTPLQCDVRDDVAVRRAVAEVLDATGRLEVLVNNAGATLMGAVEETTVEQAQALFDLNVFGTVRMTHAALPAMRRQRSGRLIFIGSVVGFLPMPFMPFYAASKHAVEGLAESLDHEVRELGIRAVVIEPGFIRTAIDSNATVAAGDIAEYATLRRRANEWIRASVRAGDDAALVAAAVLRAVEARDPLPRYTVGRGAGTLALLRRAVPAGIFGRVFRTRIGLAAGAA